MSRRAAKVGSGAVNTPSYNPQRPVLNLAIEVPNSRLDVGRHQRTRHCIGNVIMAAGSVVDAVLTRS